MRIIVLYEDSKGEAGDFGFHTFICQCVLDKIADLAASVYRVEKDIIAGIQLKGAGNVLKKCRTDLQKLAKHAQMVIAVYDQDAVTKHLGMLGTQCRSTLRDKLAELCEPKNALEIILIRQNLETVIEKIRDSGFVGFISASVFEKALNKDRSARDSLFIQCATKTEAEIRNKLLGILPDVDRLVSKLVANLQAAV